MFYFKIFLMLVLSIVTLIIFNDNLFMGLMLVIVEITGVIIFIPGSKKKKPKSHEEPKEIQSEPHRPKTENTKVKNQIPKNDNYIISKPRDTAAYPTPRNSHDDDFIRFKPSKSSGVTEHTFNEPIFNSNHVVKLEPVEKFDFKNVSNTIRKPESLQENKVAKENEDAKENKTDNVEETKNNSQDLGKTILKEYMESYSNTPKREIPETEILQLNKKTNPEHDDFLETPKIEDIPEIEDLAENNTKIDEKILEYKRLMSFAEASYESLLEEDEKSIEEPKKITLTSDKEKAVDITSDNIFKHTDSIISEEHKSVIAITEAPINLAPDEKIIPESKEYIKPPLDFLRHQEEFFRYDCEVQAKLNSEKLIETLENFGIKAEITNISIGPAVTRFEIKPSSGVKVNKIVNLLDDIALNLAAKGVRIEAPIPGKPAVGIEVANRKIEPVYIRSILESEEFKTSASKTIFALGKDVTGENVIADISKMVHVLIAGATGSGKSVCINSILISLLYNSSPEEIKLILIDPKMVELNIYNGIPHLLIPVVTEPQKAAAALGWAVHEMLSRYQKFKEVNVRDIHSYNKINDKQKMPQIIIIIDELADIMATCSNEVEDYICRLSQMARAAGMHLIIATQRPSVDIITGVIKANIPSRIAFMVASQVDSRTILDSAGAEKLIGAGDMLMKGNFKPVRVQGAYVSGSEIIKVTDFIKERYRTEYDKEILEKINNENNMTVSGGAKTDELFNTAVEFFLDIGQVSITLLQKKYKIGYSRAEEILAQMEALKIVTPPDGENRNRQFLISMEDWQKMNV